MRGRLLVILMLTGMLATACGGEDAGGGGGENGGSPTGTITMIDNEFQPSDPVVSPGSTLDLKNDGQALHSFTIDDQEIDEQVQPGAEATVTISLEAGEYGFDCSFHPEMTGTLTVQ